ncbi:MAG TPA: PDZ domain-containing protein [Pyrinomonadaceae bacterium]|nr:PDZ domain-containing protein [Pyrinomonadaceae bacterium]
MQTEAHRDNQRSGESETQSAGNCPNCGALMPRELRFCRSCGCRLGEGVEEYTETVRFDGATATARAGKSRTASAKFPGTSPADKQEFKAMAHRIHEKTVSSVTSGLSKFKIRRACNRVPRWMIWVIIPIMIASMTGGFRNSMRSRNRQASASSASSGAQNSYLGAEYKTTQGGVMILDVSPPGSAADKAGLIGGDIITTFKGKPVKSEGEMSALLSATPAGETVEVGYIRDGETKTAKLTTVTEEENDRFAEVFSERPEGNGFLGVNDGELKRVKIPEMNIYGVQVNEVYKNRPAYIAGLRDGDIIIEFNNAPIRTPEEFNKRIDRALPDSTVKVVVVRGGQRMEIPIKMGEE